MLHIYLYTYDIVHTQSHTYLYIGTKVISWESFIESVPTVTWPEKFRTHSHCIGQGTGHLAPGSSGIGPAGPAGTRLLASGVQPYTLVHSSTDEVKVTYLDWGFPPGESCLFYGSRQSKLRGLHWQKLRETGSDAISAGNSHVLKTGHI